jgi:cyclic pyranopterin phosphate synthase
MAEEMTFLPRAQLLTLEEQVLIAKAFIKLGVKKIRVTGGEPLVRRNVLSLLSELGHASGLDELALTTNGSQLERLAVPLKEAGVQRINISLDTLQPEKFKQITRTGDLNKVLSGISAARAAGFQGLKINAVIMKNSNDDEIIDLAEFAFKNDLDISFIEEMPLGEIDEHNRALAFCSSQQVRDKIAEKYQLISSSANTGGPSRYWNVPGYKTRLGFISPHSENFCGDCNRVRLTVEGRLLLCLGNEHSVDLRAVVRGNPGDEARLIDAIVKAITVKPERHYFDLNAEPTILRFMNASGG